MDPISQGALGAALAQSQARKSEIKWATLVGILSGMSADLDSFIRSNDDPLLYFEYHRHFSHSLIFVPMGALLCAIFFKWILKKIAFRRIYFYSFLGYGTHALLDACTNFGTQLFWPFSHQRIAWNNVSIVDPIWTLGLIAFVVAAFRLGNAKWASLGLAFAISYLLLGVGQRIRAESRVKALAQSRGHVAKRIHVGPSFGNLLLWRGMYEHEGRFYVDAIRLGFQTQIFFGESLEVFKKDKISSNIEPRFLQDIERFNWFAMEYLAFHPTIPNIIIDARYSALPNSVAPLWGIDIKPSGKPKHVSVEYYQEARKADFQKLWAMLKGNLPSSTFRP